MCVSKNIQIQGICISDALFLFYAPKFLKHPKIILSFLRYLRFNAKIPHRSAGFLPASFLSMQVGGGEGSRIICWGVIVVKYSMPNAVFSRLSGIFKKCCKLLKTR